MLPVFVAHFLRSGRIDTPFALLPVGPVPKVHARYPFRLVTAERTVCRRDFEPAGAF